MATGLDDLLSGVPGFSKPSMKELKQQSRGPGSTPLQANAASRSPAATGSASPLRPSQAPGAAPAAVPSGLDSLDHLVKSQSSPALAAQRCAYPPAALPTCLLVPVASSSLTPADGSCHARVMHTMWIAGHQPARHRLAALVAWAALAIGRPQQGQAQCNRRPQVCP